MNHRQIEAFRAVVQLGSMTNAAELLGISQPAVSRLIRDLEANLGLQLFRREGNRLVPAREAMVLFQEVDLHYRGLSQIEKVARDLRGRSGGSLRVAGTSSLSTFFLPDVAAEFLSEQPSVDVSISSLHSAVILERVALQQFDMGLVQLSGDHAGVRIISLPVPASVCILHPDHDLARHSAITPQLLKGRDFISLGINSPLRARVDGIFADLGIERALRIEASLAASVRSLVARNLGVAIVDPFVASTGDAQNVLVRPFQPTIPFEVAVVIPAHRSLTALAQQFLDLIRLRFRQKADQFR